MLAIARIDPAPDVLHDSCALALTQLEVLGRAFDSERGGLVFDAIQVGDQRQHFSVLVVDTVGGHRLEEFPAAVTPATTAEPRCRLLAQSVVGGVAVDREVAAGAAEQSVGGGCIAAVAV